MKSTSAQVSDRARQGLDHFLAVAARHALVAEGQPLELVADDDSTPGESDVIMLTVSSYRFRALLFIHFDRDPGTRAHFAALAGQPLDEMTGERFVDTLMERGNLVCGALNRDLAQHFPHIGMSTPCLLRRSSIEHLGAVGPTHSRRYRADIAPGVAMHFTLALCAFEDLDFPYEPRTAEAEAAEDTSGELELF